MTVAQIGDIQLNNAWTDAQGALYYMDRLDGWDSPPLRSNAAPLPSQHGEVQLESLYGARLITLGGLCKATSETNFFLSMYYLMAQTNALVNTVTLKVTEEIARQCEVLRAGPVRTTYTGVGAFTFEVSLRANDPWKYASTVQSEALAANVSETLANSGTVPTYPIITLTASGAPTITVGPFTWFADQSLPSGTVIDMKAQTAVNGATSYFHLVNLTSDWLALEPGNNTVASSVACEVDWRSAWV
jgi:hypothetical protein